MADETQAVDNAQDLAPTFSLQRVYIKDLSLEMPNAPHIFLEQTTPTVEIALNVGGERLAETVFEASVRATVTTKVGEQVLYLVEATQAGIFEIANIPEDQFNPLLGIVCPSMLFPYLRANVADAINRTSLPPLHLAEVNFQSLFEQNAMAQAEAARAEAGTEEEK